MNSLSLTGMILSGFFVAICKRYSVVADVRQSAES
jgi:hypothetical protein